MKRNLFFIFLSALLLLTACSEKGEQNTSAIKDNKEEEQSSTQEITYLGEKYEIPANVETIVTASQEAMEDAAILGIKPAGAIATAGEFPAYLGDSMSEAEQIGEKTQPSVEKLLQIKPDVILGTSKFQPEVAESLNKVAPMIPVSHISTNWKDNLLLLGELSNETDKAESIIADYEKNVTETKEKLQGELSDKEVVMLRLRGGSLYVYPETVYFNPVLYTDLGLDVPDEVKAAKVQEMISLEKLAEMNPDYLFIQFEESENAERPTALADLENNSIWKSLDAVKNNQVYENVVDPMAAGGTAWSKTTFLTAFTELFK
ncbi:iron-hydroxamate ABC transporter substrate-binding protein [Niallia sp. FSL W8-0635]|uniref:iron-hydroxamate ABC transporter substrate-binding protein n=1 Tax=Niallia sp. FSL W8-0635 TaxID=2975337 RepID=UPI0009C8D903|nr:ABC-type Fe3+-hydroxamate transport system, periplasmic component [Mycobacteroides abscessus subsp. abscessus]HEO8421516.1 iron-hydroxamate ABC transporter substrate-binding protein [Yersinia enterocolitica]